MTDTYKPSSRTRISIVGALRNAAEELDAVFSKRERMRKDHGEDCECDDCGEQDWSGFYAETLKEIAGNLCLLDANPAELFEFADLYALHGLAAAHVPAKEPS